MKQFYLLLMALLMSLSANAEESGTCGGSLKWHLTDDGTLTISGKGKMWDYYYSGNYNRDSPWGTQVKHIIIGDSVTTIGDGAFYYCTSLKEVTIPNSVTTIGDGAFDGCSSLKEITIPNSVTTIENSAFKGCKSLISVAIPNSITTIGDYAFKGCKSLISVAIPNSITTIGDYAFQDCSALISVAIPNSITTIGRGTFYGCTSLSSVTIPNSVTTIESSAFYDCRALKSVIIGSNVTSISYDAFTNSFISKVIWLTNTPPSGYSNVDGRVHYVANDLYTGLSNTKVYPYLSSMFEVGGVKYVPVSPSERTCDAIDCIYTGAPYDVNINGKVNYKGIDMTVKSINSYTAYNCLNIKKIDISVDEEIGDNAFKDCDSLSSVMITKVNDIGNNAFASCSKIASVTITKANNIGNNAFKGCFYLTELALGSNIKSLGESAFSGCSSLKQFVIPDSVSMLNQSLLSSCTSLESIRIHKGIKDIKNNVFDGCTNLSTLIIDDRDIPLNLSSYNYPPRPLFSDCKLDSVYIGGKIVYNTSSDNGYSPFYRNTSLRSVKISDVETTIYDNEFYGCTNLQNVSIGDSVKSIGRWAFSGCNSLNHFDFGSGLQTIGQEAFSDCSNVTEISSEALVPPTCDTNALDDINKWTCKLIVPKASMDAYKQAEQWKEFFFIEENTTGIQAMTSDKEPRSDVYSLTGAKVLDNASLQDVQSLPKGIYVIKGKKIIVK